VTRSNRRSPWQRLSFSRSDWLSLILALSALAVAVTVILVGLAYVGIVYAGIRAMD
jgi:hypothetical protein